MRYLLSLALIAPISYLFFISAYNTIVYSNASLSRCLLSLAVCALPILVSLNLIKKHLFERRSVALGCKDAPMLPHRDPILGLDNFAEALRALKSNRLMDFYSARFAQYGHTYYNIVLGRRVLMTNESENIKTILATKMDDWPIDGPRLYAVLPVLGPRSIFASNGQLWHDARAMIRPSFVRDQVADLRCFDRHIQNYLAAVPRDGSTFDLQELLLRMTMDSATDFMLGFSTNLLVKAEPDAQRFLQDFDYASHEAAKRGRLGPLLTYLPHRKMDEAVRRMRTYLRFYVQKAIAKKEQEGGADTGKERNYVFLDELLKANAPEEHVIDQILSIIIAGRDTTAASLAAVFYCLARDPAAVERLRAEIAAVGEEIPSWEQLKQMKYLNNVIKEGQYLLAFPSNYVAWGIQY